MYIEQSTGAKKTASELRKELNASFCTGADLAHVGYVLLEEVQPPTPGELEAISEGPAEEYEPGRWRQTWVVTQIEPTVPRAVTALQGMLAIDAAGLTSAFLAWKGSLDPVEDFAAIAFLEKAQRWDYDDPILNAALHTLGVDGRKDALFTLASTL